MSDPFAPIAGKAKRANLTVVPPTMVVVMPVPTEAPAPPQRHPTLGQPILAWTYTDSAGRVLGYVHRYDKPKQFRPLTLWRHAAGAALEWRWESWPPKRPLYGLARLAEKPTAPVMVCEGEKAADAATRLLGGFAGVTSPNGSKSAGKADWTPLRGRAVIIWPDADTSGLDYAHAVARQVVAAGALSVAIVELPEGVKESWDAADAELDGWDTARAIAMVSAAKPVDDNTRTAERARGAYDRAGNATDGPAAPCGRRRAPQRDTLITLTEFVEFWHDANRTAYASFPVKSHREHWDVRSRDFRMWLSGRYYQETGSAIGGQALEDGMRILEARAVNEGPQHEPFRRVGHQAGNLYLDLCDATWRAVEVTATGWQVIEKPPLKLLRSQSMRPLPEPEGGSLLEHFRHFFNVNDDDFMLVIACLVAALRPRGPFPILVVNGAQGTGKSVFSRIVRSLIDPSAAPIRAMPKDDRDLVVSAGNSWMLAYDNLSSVAAWFSDALCRLATGGGFATRMLHTDKEEMIFEASRPLLLNGIPTLTDRADLADRALTIHLKSVPEDERRPEDGFFADFESARPRILGALLDAVSAALRNLPNVRLERSPRMADFVKWITAAESGLGWEPGAFLAAYQENRRDVSESAFEADPVAVATYNFVKAERPDGFEGTATELLKEINNWTTDSIRNSRSWPQNASQLGNRIERAKPLLVAKGFFVERRHSGTRTITIVPPKAS